MFASADDVAVFSSISKVVVFNTDLISPVSSTSSKGVMVQKAKNNSKVASVKLLADAGLTSIDYYRCGSIPAIGVYLKKQENAR
jgi:DNA gyrase subunit A